jgi:hypothetical protein
MIHIYVKYSYKVLKYILILSLSTIGLSRTTNIVNNDNNLSVDNKGRRLLNTNFITSNNDKKEIIHHRRQMQPQLFV